MDVSVGRSSVVYVPYHNGELYDNPIKYGLDDMVNMRPLGVSILCWCRGCNLAVLDSKRCPRCGGDTSRIEYNFDIRPAFQYDRDRLRRTVDGQYGEGVFELLVPDDRLILFGIEFKDEVSYRVICDGYVLGDLDADDGIWRFTPTLRAASLMAGAVSKRLITVSSRGQSMAVRMHHIPGEGIKDCDPDIRKGDTVFIRNGSGAVKCFGRAMADSDKLVGTKFAVKSANALNEDIRVPDKGYTWKETVNLNKGLIDAVVKRSTDFVRDVVKKHKGKAFTVSLSGGKDSLATLLVVLKAGIRPKIIYAETHMDCGSAPLVKSIAKRYGLEMVSCGIPEDVLYRNIERLGPPSVDYRWCCKIHQLSQFQILALMIGGQNLSFVGQRRYEGTKRMQNRSEWINQSSPSQICASPIQEWNALHVWMFLTAEDAPYNRLYEQGFDRIGCYWCPVEKPTQLAEVQWDDPVAIRWKEGIDRYGKEKDMPQVWHDRMLWRNRKVQGNIPGIDPQVQREIEHKQRIVSYRPVISGASVSFGRKFDPSKLLPLLPIIGRQGYMDGDCLISGDLRIYPDGHATSTGGSDKDLKRSAEDILELSLMATFCLECTLCTHQCKSSALVFKDGGILLDASKCNGCRECMKICPSIHILRN